MQGGARYSLICRASAQFSERNGCGQVANLSIDRAVEGPVANPLIDRGGARHAAPLTYISGRGSSQTGYAFNLNCLFEAWEYWKAMFHCVAEGEVEAGTP